MWKIYAYVCEYMTYPFAVRWILLPKNPVENLSRANLKINRLIFHRKVFNSIPFALSHFCFLCARFIVSRGERGADSNIRKVDYKYRVTPVFRAWLTKYINHFVAKCKAPHCGGRYTQITKLIPLPELSVSTFRGKDTENSRAITAMDHMGRMFAWQLMMSNYRHVEDTRHAYLVFGKY